MKKTMRFDTKGDDGSENDVTLPGYQKLFISVFVVAVTFAIMPSIVSIWVAITTTIIDSVLANSTQMTVGASIATTSAICGGIAGAIIIYMLWGIPKIIDALTKAVIAIKSRKNKKSSKES